MGKESKKRVVAESGGKSPSYRVHLTASPEAPELGATCMHGYHGDEGERKTQVQKLPVFLWEIEVGRPGIQGQPGLHERLSHKKM